jgi:C-terminal processing protease CtpA/Prc
MSMEYRGWITIPGIPAAAEGAWMAIMDHLQEHSGGLGPVASWDDRDAMTVVLAVEADTPATAAGVMVGEVVGALAATGHGEHVPAGIEIEDVSDEQAVLVS